MGDFAILNITIAPGDWPKGPFSSIKELKRAYDQVKNLEFFVGDFSLLNSGKLKRGFEKGLHTIVRDIDENLGSNKYHLHNIGPGGVLYLYKKGNKLVTENYSSTSFADPIYSLNGLYDLLPNQEEGTKIKAIKQEFHKRECHDMLTKFNQSISKSNKLKLKLLENLYKEKILSK